MSKPFGRVWALEEVTLELEPGQVVGVLGANGAGKTTLLNCLAGVVAPSRGRIDYDGERFHRGKLELRRRLMFLPDFPMAFARMNVLQHVAMCVRLYERPEPNVEQVVKILDQLSLLALAEMPLGTMSRGQAAAWAPLGLMMGLWGAKSAGMTAEEGCWVAARILLAFLALMPVLVAGKFSKGTNDTLNLGWKMLPVLGFRYCCA